MIVKILGSGCANCNTLEARTVEALGRLGLAASVEHVRDFGDIASYGIMKTPGLVIDEEVVVSGRVPTTAQLVDMIKDAVA